MRRQAKFIFSLTAVLFFAFATVKAQSSVSQPTQQPAVVKAVSPSAYPPIAVAARAEGRVVVEVKINAAGKVTSAQGIKGHKLLQKVSENAAKRWEFVIDEISKERIVNVTFIFHIISKDKDQETAFHPPYEIEFNYLPPEIIGLTNSDPPNIPKKH